MPRNGTGTMIQETPVATGPTVWADTKAAGNTIITTADHDFHDQDFAAALTASIANDGQTPILANLPMSTFRHTGVGNGVARTDYAALGQLQDGEINWVAAGGTANAITATYSPALTALTDGQLCGFRAASANTTTTPTFAPNGLTAHTITQSGGQAVTASSWVANFEVLIRYNLANTRWEMVSAPLLAALRSGATVTNPMSSNLVLSATSNQVQTVAPNASGLAIQLPDATGVLVAVANMFEINNLPTNGRFAVQIIDSASNVIGWLKTGVRMLVHLDSIASATGNWRLQTGDVWEDSSGAYVTTSVSSPTGTALASASCLCACQLSATNGILMVANGTTLGFFGWTEGEGGKNWGAKTSVTITTGKWPTIIPLTATTALAIYVTATPNIVAAVMSLNTSTLAVTANAASTISSDVAASTKFAGGTALSSTLAFVAYSTSAGAIKGCTVSISGTTATANTVAPSGVTITGSVPSAAFLSATVAHTYFTDSSNGLSVMRASVSGTTVSWASAVIVKSDTTYGAFTPTPIDATHSGVVYCKDGSTPALTSSVVVTDGSPVVVGTESASILTGVVPLGSVSGNTSSSMPQLGSKAYGIFCIQGAGGGSNGTTSAEIVRFALSTTAITVDKARPLPFLAGTGLNSSSGSETIGFSGIFQVPWVNTGAVNGLPQTILSVGA